jgi:peptidoglycan/LPS O-acetylase OafA/YrhL
MTLLAHNRSDSFCDSHIAFRPDIDGLRAVAVLSVVLFHAFPHYLPGGFIGVDIFFIISGYLISTIILRDLSSAKFSFLSFYARRIRRIFPALSLILAFCLLAGWQLLLANEYEQLGKHVVGGAFFFSNFILLSEVGYFDSAAEAKPLLHLWSLAIEEQFYIVYPLLMRIAWALRRSVGLLLLSLVFGSFLFNLHLSNTNPAADFYLPLSRLWQLGLGGGLAYLCLFGRLLHVVTSRLRNLLSLAGVFLIILGLLLIDKSSVFPGVWALLPSVGTAMIIASSSAAWINRNMLSVKTLVWVGGISYPLYLWHWPVLSFMRIVWGVEPSATIRACAILASLLLAWLTVVFVERPLRFGRNRGTKVLALTSTIALLGYLGYRCDDSQGYPGRSIYTKNGEIRSAYNQDSRISNPASCPLTETVSAQFAISCSLHINPHSSTKLVMWSDSNGQSWQPAFRVVAERNEYQLYIVSHPGCPPLPGVRRSDNLNNSMSCLRRENTLEILDSILALKPDIVVLAARWSMYTKGWMRDGRLCPATHFVTTSEKEPATAETSTSALREKLPQLVERLRSHGIKVILLKEPPILKNSNVRLDRSLVETSLDEQRALAKTSDEIISAIPNLATYDPANKLCTPRCMAYLDDKSIYFDDAHLNEGGSLLFVDDIAVLLRDALAR